MPRTLAQNAQYIAETIKPAIKSAIEAQGVTVPSTDSFLDYADRIGEIEGGGSGYQLKDLPTGSISTVTDAAELPLNALKVSVEAQQDLHGYDKPWVGGAGKNKYPIAVGRDLFNNNAGGTHTTDNDILQVTCTAGSNASGVYTNSNSTIRQVFATQTPCYISFDIVADRNATVRIGTNSTPTKSIGTTKERWNIYISEDTTIVIYGISNNVTLTISNFMISKTEENRYYSYENICPIEGWDSGEITVCDDIQNPTQTETTALDFPTTIYGGEWDVTNGGMKQTDGYIASYNGETLPSTWISDRDVYASGTTPTIGAEVVYKLATPTTIDLSPLSIRMLEGTNNLYADCGEVIEGEYFVDEGAHRYQLYDYIESDGTQVIDLGFAPENGATVTTSFVLLSTQTSEVFVYGATDNSAWLGFAQNPASRNTIYENNTSGRSEAYIQNQQYLLTLTASRDYTNHLCMFGFYLNGYAPGIKTRLCYCKYNDNFYLPAKRKSDGVFGLYDVTNQTFLTDSAGGNAFVGGNPTGVEV